MGQKRIGANRLTLLLDERRGSSWQKSLRSIAARRSKPLDTHREHEVCAQCHSRRAQIAEGYHAGLPLLDHYLPVLLESGLYHADGQQRDEVFISASFAQSRMFAAGVTCSDCHEPHSQQLRLEGNALCGQCHMPTRFDTAEHHFHPTDSTGAQCVNCHMPETTYMVIDPRRDHSLRIPRPDLSERLGTPNACNQCHAERSPSWAAGQIHRNYNNPKPELQAFADIFAAAGQGHPDAQRELSALVTDPGQPAVVRASAAARLGLYASEANRSALIQGLQDANPQVRIASASSLAREPATSRAKWLSPLLEDPLRAVRSEAARLLADLALSPTQPPALKRALAKHEAGLMLYANRADSWVALAALSQRQGKIEDTRTQLEKALRLEPLHLQARLNLADLLRALGQDSQAAELLSQGTARQPQAALLHYALGLTQVRQQQPKAARASLERAFQLSPDDARIAYAHALSLWPRHPEQALDKLQHAVQQHPYEIPLINAAAALNWQAGHHASAQHHARCLQILDPDSETATRILRASDQTPVMATLYSPPTTERPVTVCH